MQTITIPRLELCDSALLVDLITEVITEFHKINIKVEPSNVTLWSDLTVVIS